MTRLHLLVFLAVVASPWAVHAQDFELPPEFTRTDESVVEDGMDYLYTVTPTGGPFAGLSTIRLSRMAAPVEDVDAWLKGRLSADVGDMSAAEGLFTSPDSPFSDPAFESVRRALPQLFAELQALAELPLEFCDGPQTGYNATGGYRELACTFDVGPLRQFLVLRLQRAGEATYFTEIRTMNERRLRHLLAIADSFTAGDI